MRPLLLMVSCTCLWAGDGFVSLIAKKSLSEHWIVDGKAPAEAWTLADRAAFGSWDKYEITSIDGKVKVVLNGVLVNEGMDAMPADGNICLQSEGWPVYYRNVSIKVLQ